jgi:hypothetical protein
LILSISRVGTESFPTGFWALTGAGRTSTKEQKTTAKAIAAKMRFIVNSFEIFWIYLRPERIFPQLINERSRENSFLIFFGAVGFNDRRPFLRVEKTRLYQN